MLAIFRSQLAVARLRTLSGLLDDITSGDHQFTNRRRYQAACREAVSDQMRAGDSTVVHVALNTYTRNGLEATAKR